MKFNHRLSHLDVATTPEDVRYAVVGGGSTTGAAIQRPEGCVGFDCAEFSAEDAAEITIERAAVRTRAATGSGEVHGTVGTTLREGTVVIPLSHEADPSDPVWAVFSGLTLSSTEVSLSVDDVCYQPGYGWLPREMRFEIVDAAVSSDGAEARVTVEVGFIAGKAYEAQRACMDEIIEHARVDFSVDVSVIAGGDEVFGVPVEQVTSYGYRDDEGALIEQPPPANQNAALDAEALWGWSKLHWTLDPGAEDDQGTYVRSLSFSLDPEAGSAWGHATNYSPVTQLTGLTTTFEGQVVGILLGRDAVVSDHGNPDLLPTVDDAGQVVVTTETAPTPE